MSIWYYPESAEDIPEPDAEDVYEECPICHNEGHGGCYFCWDLGMVPHACGAPLS